MAKKKKSGLDYAKMFDRLMTKRFNELFKTEWNILAGSFGAYNTVRENGKKFTKEMFAYGQGLSDGIVAVQEWHKS